MLVETKLHGLKKNKKLDRIWSDDDAAVLSSDLQSRQTWTETL